MKDESHGLGGDESNLVSAKKSDKEFYWY
jgi:hypothetical protein